MKRLKARSNEREDRKNWEELGVNILGRIIRKHFPQHAVFTGSRRKMLRQMEKLLEDKVKYGATTDGELLAYCERELEAAFEKRVKAGRRCTFGPVSRLIMFFLLTTAQKHRLMGEFAKLFKAGKW